MDRFPHDVTRIILGYTGNPKRWNKSNMDVIISVFKFLKSTHIYWHNIRSIRNTEAYVIHKKHYLAYRETIGRLTGRPVIYKTYFFNSYVAFNLSRTHVK